MHEVTEKIPKFKCLNTVFIDVNYIYTINFEFLY